jgi:hypothetical protein
VLDAVLAGAGEDEGDGSHGALARPGCCLGALTACLAQYWACMGAPGLANAVVARAQAVYWQSPYVPEML